MSRFPSIVLGAVIAVFGSILFMEQDSFAAKNRSQSFVSPPSESRSSSRQEMLLDFTMHYLRDTKPDGGTDTAGRFSVGGMFNEWLGLDLQGVYQIRAKNYLVGFDFRFVPVDWFFLKGGAGGYAQKSNHQLALTPIAGAGIMARISREVYLVTETSYFSANERDNVGFGIGLGTIF